MPDETVKEQANKLRQDLRDKRQGIATPEKEGEISDGRIRPEDASEPGGTGEGIVRFSELNHTEIRAALSTPGGAFRASAPVGGIVTGSRKPNRNYRPSIERLPIGPGRSDGRSSTSDQRTADTPGTAVEEQPAARVGRLETHEDITIRPDPEPEQAIFSAEAGQSDGAIPTPSEQHQEVKRILYKEDYQRVGRSKKYGRLDNPADEIGIKDYDQLPSREPKEIVPPRKRPEPEAEPKQKWYAQGSVLSAKEAKDYLEPLMEALKDDFHYIDEALWLLNPTVNGQDIWGNIDADEQETLAKIMIKRGQKNEVAASAVRGLLESHDYIVVGALFIPRIKQTVDVIRSAPKRQRRKIQLFRGA